MNVEVKDKRTKEEKENSSKSTDTSHDVLLPQRGLFALTDIEEGEIIYEEDAVVSTLLPDEEASKEFCHHCQKYIPAPDKSDKPTKESQEESEQVETRKETEDVSIETTEETVKVTEAETEAKTVDDEASEKNNEVEENTSEKQNDKVKIDATNEDTDVKASAEESKSNPNALECEDCRNVAYCSEKCRTDAYDAYHQILCPSSGEASSFLEDCKQSHELAPIIISKFFGTLIDKEKKRRVGSCFE